MKPKKTSSSVWSTRFMTGNPPWCVSRSRRARRETVSRTCSVMAGLVITSRALNNSRLILQIIKNQWTTGQGRGPEWTTGVLPSKMLPFMVVLSSSPVKMWWNLKWQTINYRKFFSRKLRSMILAASPAVVFYSIIRLFDIPRSGVDPIDSIACPTKDGGPREWSVLIRVASNLIFVPTRHPVSRPKSKLICIDSQRIC